MKLIIDIPEDVYTIIKNEPYMSRVMNFGSTLTDAIYDGTPLPKRHGRLIDENEIKQMIKDAKVKNEASKNFAENIIRFAPTIIKAELKGE